MNYSRMPGLGGGQSMDEGHFSLDGAWIPAPCLLGAVWTAAVCAWNCDWYTFFCLVTPGFVLYERELLADLLSSCFSLT